MRRRTEAEWKEHIKRNVSIDPITGCWNWMLYRKDGYGYAGFMGGYDRVHRIAWMVFRGPIPKGLLACHHCDNPPCCNPDHLFLGTNHDNILDATRKGRRETPYDGENNGRAKLTPEIVLEIRRLRPYGDFRVEVAAKYGISIDTICNIITRKTWNHLPA